MAAPDIPTIYDFEGAFETLAKTFLQDALTPTVTVNTTFSQDNLDTPRIDLRFEVGEAQPETLPFANVAGDTEEHVAYSAILVADVVTDNEFDTQATHRSLRAQVRDIFRRNGSNWTTASLPYHEFRHIRPSGTGYSTDGNLQSSELRFDLTFNIRSDAFPS
tara:strand:- start:539 stop:1024 length:486 start_codon:yes stop_codon:yes gene_type:complete